LPNWTNYAFGLPIGAISGILAMGILLLGAGMVQSTRDLMGWSGAGRAPRTGQVGMLGEERLWLPAHEIAYEFYGWLSVTSLSTDEPLRQWYPRLDWQAESLMRDSFGDGKGKLSLHPNGASIASIIHAQGVQEKTGRPIEMYAVKIHFSEQARDWG